MKTNLNPKPKDIIIQGGWRNDLGMGKSQDLSILTSQLAVGTYQVAVETKNNKNIVGPSAQLELHATSDAILGKVDAGVWKVLESFWEGLEDTTNSSRIVIFCWQNRNLTKVIQKRTDGHGFPR